MKKEQKVFAEAVEHSDVRGNVKFYLKLTNEKNEEYIINVGKKTFDTVTKMKEEQNDLHVKK